MSKIFGATASALILFSTLAAAQTIFDQVSPEIVKNVGLRFNHNFEAGGMSGVSTDVQKCYDAASFARTAQNEEDVAECILYDLSARDMDQGFRENLLARGLRDPGPVTPFLSDQSFAARMSIYSSIPFGDATPEEILKYYGNAPNDVLEEAIQK